MGGPLGAAGERRNKDEGEAGKGGKSKGARARRFARAETQGNVGQAERESREARARGKIIGKARAPREEAERERRGVVPLERAAAGQYAHWRSRGSSRPPDFSTDHDRAEIAN